MNKDFSSREWAETHARFSQDIARAAASIMQAFHVLKARQYDAPWRAFPHGDDCAAR